MNDLVEIGGRDMVPADMSVTLNTSEIHAQVATAHQYPRSIKRFRDDVQQMVTLNENVAGECIYALPRDGKVIEGPSVRFAEVIASAWGNSRAGARVISEDAEFITAQGVFHDLQRNVRIDYEVRRRITTKAGKRFGADMIATTANAACSIALRNAIMRGIPKAFWADMYDAARQMAAGDIKSLSTRRADAIKAFQVYGVTEAQILAVLGREGAVDITLDDLVMLRGMLTAIKDGEASPESIFQAQDAAPKVPEKAVRHELPQKQPETVPQKFDTTTGEVSIEIASVEDQRKVAAALKEAGISNADFVEQWTFPVSGMPADMVATVMGALQK